MDKLEIIVNGEKLLELDQIDINTIKEAEQISEENFIKCIKSWATMIFLHRLSKSIDLLITNAESIDNPMKLNLYEKHGIKEIPSNRRKKIELILELVKKEKGKLNDSTSIHSS